MKRYKLVSLLSVLSFAPALAFAEEFGKTRKLLEAFGSLVQYGTIIVAALALLAFMFGLMKFIFRAGDPGKKAEGKSIMVWGIIALFVMVSLWGIIEFMQHDLLGVTSPAGQSGANCGGIYKIPC